MIEVYITPYRHTSLGRSQELKQSIKENKRRTTESLKVKRSQKNKPKNAGRKHLSSEHLTASWGVLEKRTGFSNIPFYTMLGRMMESFTFWLPECHGREYMACDARSLGGFKRDRMSARWVPQHFFRLKPVWSSCTFWKSHLFYFGNPTCLQTLGHLELVRKENGGWNPEKAAR